MSSIFPQCFVRFSIGVYSLIFASRMEIRDCFLWMFRLRRIWFSETVHLSYIRRSAISACQFINSDFLDLVFVSCTLFYPSNRVLITRYAMLKAVCLKRLVVFDWLAVIYKWNISFSLCLCVLCRFRLLYTVSHSLRIVCFAKPLWFAIVFIFHRCCFWFVSVKLNCWFW
jgi:hypothetical protein